MSHPQEPAQSHIDQKNTFEEGISHNFWFLQNILAYLSSCCESLFTAFFKNDYLISVNEIIGLLDPYSQEIGLFHSAAEVGRFC